MRMKLFKYIALFLITNVVVYSTVIDIKFDTDYNDRLIIYKDNPPSYFKNYGDTLFNEFIDKNMVFEFEIDEPQILTLYFPSTNMTDEIIVIPDDSLAIEIQEKNHQFRINEVSRKIELSTLENRKKREEIRILYKGNLTEKTHDYNDNIVKQYAEHYDRTANVVDARFVVEVESAGVNRPMMEFLEFIKSEFENDYFKEQVLLYMLVDINHISGYFEELSAYYHQIESAIKSINSQAMFNDNLHNLEVLTGTSEVEIDLLDSAMSDAEYRLVYVTASWCVPCIEYKDSVIKVLEMSKDIDNLDMQLFAVENNIVDMRKTYQQYSTEDIIYLNGINTNPLGARLNINSVPSYYLIKDNRIIKWNWISPFELPQFLRDNFDVKE